MLSIYHLGLLHILYIYIYILIFTVMYIVKDLEEPCLDIQNFTTVKK